MNPNKFGSPLRVLVAGQCAIHAKSQRAPKTSGYDVTQTLRSQPETAHITIVALTAHVMADERERAIAAGCDGYIAKPIDTRASPGQVRQYLDSRESRTGG